jgi:hypothetical protein
MFRAREIRKLGVGEAGVRDIDSRRQTFCVNALSRSGFLPIVSFRFRFAFSKICFWLLDGRHRGIVVRKWKVLRRNIRAFDLVRANGSFPEYCERRESAISWRLAARVGVRYLRAAFL